MARKKQKKRSWIPTVLFYLLFPPAIWAIAFVLWFYWYDLERLFSKPEVKPRQTTGQVETKQETHAKPEAPPTGSPQEKILDEDRKKLNEILKRLKQRQADEQTN